MLKFISQVVFLLKIRVELHLICWKQFKSYT